MAYFWITITGDALRGLESASRAPFGLTESHIRHHPDGSVEILVNDETMAAANRVRFPGESDSDLLLRLVANQRSGGKYH